MSLGFCVIINLAERIRDVHTDDDIIEAWLRGRPEGTSTLYRYAVSRFRRGVPKALADTTTEDLVDWCRRIPGAESTRERDLAIIKSLLGFGFQCGWLPRDAGRAIKLHRKLVRRPDRVLDRALIEDLVTRCPPGRDRILIEFLYATGARPMEASRLTFDDLGDGRVLLKGKGGKPRFVPVTLALIAALRSLRRPGDDDASAVFRSVRDRPMSRGTLWYVVTQLADRLVAEDVPPYAMRHSFATHQIEDGVPVHVVQKLLGHATLQSTSVYVHPPGDARAP